MGLLDCIAQTATKTEANVKVAMFDGQKEELEKFVEFIQSALAGEIVTVDKIKDVITKTGILRYSWNNNLGNKPHNELKTVESENTIAGFSQYLYEVLDERNLIDLTEKEVL